MEKERASPIEIEKAEELRILKEELGLLPEFLEKHRVCKEAAHGCRLAKNTQYFFTHCVENYEDCSWRGVSQVSITGMPELDEYILGVI